MMLPVSTPVRAKAIYKREDGAVIIDPTKCTGQRNCLDACPYGVIYFNEDLKYCPEVYLVCPSVGSRAGRIPAVVMPVRPGAFTFGEEEDFKELIAKAEILKPEAKAKPRTYYIGIPKRFIAGAVYDPEADECLEGVTVTLKDGKGKKVGSCQDG